MAARNIFLFAYFLSGFAALIYEIVWVREATHVLGASLYGVSAVTALFLARLAWGAAAGARLFSQLADSPELLRKRLRMFLGIEIAVAILGASLPLAFSAFVQESIWSGLGTAFQGSASYLLRLVFVGSLVVPTAAGIGLTFPLFISILKPRLLHAPQWLYAVNTAGAALGALVAAFLLLPALGLQASSLVGAAIDVLAGIMAVALARNYSSLPMLAAAPPAAVSKRRGTGSSALPLPVVLCIAFAGGALSLAFEITATRLLTLVLGSSTYSVSCVLSLFLIGTAIGTVIVSKYLLRYAQPALMCAAWLTLSAIYICAMLYVADELPWAFIACFNAMSSVFQDDAFAAAVAARFIISAGVVFVPTICSGAVLPLLFNATAPTDEGDSVSTNQIAARVYAVNSLGCIVGAFATGFLLIPLVSAHTVSGIQSTLLLCSLLTVGLATFVFFAWTRSYVSERETRLLINGIVTLVLAAVVLDVAFFKPTWNPIVMSSGPSFYSPQELHRVSRPAFLQAIKSAGFKANGSPLRFYRDGLNSTVTVETNDRVNAIFLKNDGKVEASLPLDVLKPAPTSDISTHLALAELPLQALATDQAKVLLIGYGTGTTAGAVQALPMVLELTIAELEPAVLEAGSLFRAVTGDPLNKSPGKPHTEVMINDGRYVLTASPQRFDAIICQPSDPWVNGASELYSLEFFRLAKSRLARGGVFCQWVPLYSISPASLGVLTRTFAEAFPEAVLYHQKDAGECILLGFNSADSSRRLIRLNTQETASFIDSKGIKQMARQIAGSTNDRRINTDDNLVTEFAAAANAMTQAQRIAQNIELIETASHR